MVDEKYPSSDVWRDNKVSQSYNNVPFFPFSKSVRRLSTWRLDGKHHWCGALVSSLKSSLRGRESIKPLL